MKENNLLKGTIIKTVLASLEAIALVGILVYSFFAAGEGVWGYWGSIFAIISILSPIYIYAIPNTIFTIHNLLLVTKNHRTPESIQKYYKLSERYLIWGMITGGLYVCLLIPIFLLENIFLFIGYRKEFASTLSKCQSNAENPLS